MTVRMGAESFRQGDRIIYNGQYIGILLSPCGSVDGLHWKVEWEDGAETDNVYPQSDMVHANGGPSSAQRGNIQAVFSPENLARVVSATGLSLQTVTEVARELRKR